MTPPRTSARVVLLDADGSVLLFCGSDPAISTGEAPRWWFTVGGRVRPGEPLARTAARETAEETGLLVDPATLVGPVWLRESVLRFNGAETVSEEFFFVHRTRRFEPSAAGRTDLERRYIHGHRWCDRAVIAALENCGQRVYPPRLGALLPAARRIADAGPGWAGQIARIS
jgi:8-oxo-dGTP pyrophosphatase MutT (NUDIX family)